jgi:hypothetical protein
MSTNDVLIYQIVKLVYPSEERVKSSNDVRVTKFITYYVLILIHMYQQIVAMYVTASSEEEAMKISNSLVSKNLAACVNIIPQIKSVYMWEGKLESSSEVLMMIKVSDHY